MSDSDAARLRAEIERLRELGTQTDESIERLLDGIAATADDWPDDLTEETALAYVQRLAVALRRFGRHADDCQLIGTRFVPMVGRYEKESEYRRCTCGLAAVPVALFEVPRIDPSAIVEQREKGWPDFHPEDYCHRCGRRNIPAWHSPEWPVLQAENVGTILCPVCFAENDPAAIWVVTRWHPPDADRLDELTAFLGEVTSLGEDARRVASCVLDFAAAPVAPTPEPGE